MRVVIAEWLESFLLLLWAQQETSFTQGWLSAGPNSVKLFSSYFVDHLAIISHLVTIKGIFQNHGEIVGQKVAGIYGFEIVYGTSSISDSRRLHLAMCIGWMAEWSTLGIISKGTLHPSHLGFESQFLKKFFWWKNDEGSNRAKDSRQCDQMAT